MKERLSLEAFTEHLGYKNASFHRDWYTLLQPIDNPEHFSPFPWHPHALKRYHWEAPRKHAKSECIAINYPSWLIGYYPDIHITVVSKTSTVAQQTVAAIKTRMETDPRYIEVFGELKPEINQKWTSTELITKRTKISKFPTLYATGLHGSLTGGGNDLIIADDIIDEDDTITTHSMEQAETWFYKVLLTTLFPWGGVLCIGTRWHYADLYTKLLEHWPHKVYKAIIDDKQQQVLWPEFWSYDKLAEQRRDLGTIYFNCQYQNDPTSMEGDLLKSEWLHPWNELRPTGKEYGPPPQGCLYFAGLDPSLGESDYFGIATLAYDRVHNQGYLVDVWAEHMSFPDILKHKVPQLHSQYHYSKMYMETNFWQKILTYLPELKGLPIVPVKTVSDKESRFIPMSSHFESKRILINPLITQRSELWNEWVQFPRGQHDDALDAVEIVSRQVMGRPVQTEPSYLLLGER